MLNEKYNKIKDRKWEKFKMNSSERFIFLTTVSLNNNILIIIDIDNGNNIFTNLYQIYCIKIIIYLFIN